MYVNVGKYASPMDPMGKMLVMDTFIYTHFLIYYIYIFVYI